MLTFAKPISLILIASESVSERQNLRQTLEIEEYVFVEAANLYNCLDIAECHHPGCAILDLAMIEVTGFSVIQFLQFLGVPLIIITENDDSDLHRHLLSDQPLATVKISVNNRQLSEKLELILDADFSNKKEARLSSLQLNLTENEGDRQTSLQERLGLAISLALQNLGEMIDCKIVFKEAFTESVPPNLLQKTLAEMLGEHIVSIAQIYLTGNFSGTAQMLVSTEVANAIALKLSEGDLSSAEFQELKVDILAELGNVSINSIIGTLSKSVKYRVQYVAPDYQEGSADGLIESMDMRSNLTMILLHSHFQIPELELDGYFLVLFPSRLLLELLFNL